LEQKVLERTAELAAANRALRHNHDQLTRLTRRLVEVQERERRTIARELHDSAGQVLTVLHLDLAALARSSGGDVKTADRLRKAVRSIEELMAELQTLSSSLHPTALERVGLSGALGGLLASVQEASGPHVVFQAYGFDDRRLPPEIELAAYRVTQEAVSNALRHAQAHNISVVLYLHPGRLQAIVEDDGIGFDPEAGGNAASSRPGGLGLISMHERTEMVGGHLTVETRLGEGTTVFMEIPVAHNADRKP
jgi:signal transduction histidine kinase